MWQVQISEQSRIGKRISTVPLQVGRFRLTRLNFLMVKRCRKATQKAEWKFVQLAAAGFRKLIGSTGIEAPGIEAPGIEAWDGQLTRRHYREAVYPSSFRDRSERLRARRYREHKRS